MSFSINLTDKIAECDDDIKGYCLEIEKTETISPDTRICPLLKNQLSLIKTERLIYTALLNPNSNKKIYKILLAKWEELTGLSYEILSELVVAGAIPESKYIGYCKESLEYRENMRICCSMGYGERL